MARLVRKNAGSSHSYRIDGEWVPGVTTVIGTLNKPALVNWAAEQSAAYADEHWDRLSGLRSADRIKEIREARWATNRQAIARGRRIHAMAEKIAHGDRPEIPTDIAPVVQAVADMLDTYKLETVATEVSVGSLDYRYAGTADAIVHSPRWGNVLVDYKTGSGVYAEVGLQLAAYRYADVGLFPRTVVGPRGGVRTEWDERPMPEINHCMAVHVHTTDVELVPVKAGGEQFSAFLSLLDVFSGWVLKTGWDYRDREGRDWPIGSPLDGPESDLPEGW